MSEDHALPPDPGEHRRRIGRLKTIVPVALFVLVVLLWLLLEFGGPRVEEALGMAGAAVVVIWGVMWPVRKWREWQKRRRRNERAA